MSLNRENFIFRALTNCLNEGSVKESERRRGYYTTGMTTLKKASVPKADKKLEEQKLNDASLLFTEQPFKGNGSENAFVEKVSRSSISELKKLQIEENYSPKHEPLSFLAEKMSDNSEKDNFSSVNTAEIRSSKGSVKKENSSRSQLSNEDKYFNEGVSKAKIKVSSLDDKSRKILSQSMKILSTIENNAEKIETFPNNVKDAKLFLKKVSARIVRENKNSFKDGPNTYTSPRQGSPALVQNCNAFKIGTKRQLGEVVSVVKSKKTKVTEKDEKYNLNPLNNPTTSSSNLKVPKRKSDKVEMNKSMKAARSKVRKCLIEVNE